MSMSPISGSVPPVVRTEKAQPSGSNSIAPSGKGGPTPVAVKSAAIAEATESPAQTLAEASRGDHQAQKLLHHGNVGTAVNTKA